MPKYNDKDLHLKIISTIRTVC